MNIPIEQSVHVAPAIIVLQFPLISSSIATLMATRELAQAASTTAFIPSKLKTLVTRPDATLPKNPGKLSNRHSVGLCGVVWVCAGLFGFGFGGLGVWGFGVGVCVCVCACVCVCCVLCVRVCACACVITNHHQSPTITNQSPPITTNHQPITNQSPTNHLGSYSCTSPPLLGRPPQACLGG